MRTIQLGDYVCKIGENAKENWDLVDKAKKHHWFFHLTDFASPYVVLECDKDGPNAHVKENCAELCVQYSKHSKTRNMKVDATTCGNVKVDRKDAVGECDYKNEAKVEIIVCGYRKGSAKQDSESQPPEQGTEAIVGKAAGKGKASKGYSRDAGLQQADSTGPLEGEFVSVQKTKGPGGFATLVFKSTAVRNALLRDTPEVIVQGGVTVKLQPQCDQATKEEVPDAIFGSWGRKVEEKSPVSERELLKCFELIAKRAFEKIERAAPKSASSAAIDVRKAAVGGCAVVTFQDTSLRDSILSTAKELTMASGVVVKIQPQRDPKTKEEVPNQVFVAWGRKVEEKTPVSEKELLNCLEAHCQSGSAVKLDADRPSNADCQAKPDGSDQPETA
eukprot:TRINITY_DN105380_c0_g1_i1.p1 TRINITY_DN105380_c0_g1~~TRINITY_DN105380_c0_g1_i1.p1  ORF type:complete len:389 (+),score=69.85 TRINITY_DN105380_c0_g1_i1:197-1363(+)